jgi:hypothetical protein
MIMSHLILFSTLSVAVLLFLYFLYCIGAFNFKNTEHWIEEKDVIRTDVSCGCCHIKPYNEKDPFNMCKWYVTYIKGKVYYVAGCTPRHDNGELIYYIFCNPFKVGDFKCGCGKLIQYI